MASGSACQGSEIQGPPVVRLRQLIWTRLPAGAPVALPAMTRLPGVPNPAIAWGCSQMTRAFAELLKVAVQLRFADNVTAPSRQSLWPLQPANVEPEADVAASATDELTGNQTAQVAPHWIPAGELVTVPVPVPLLADSETVQTLAELGVILLMFSLGIEFSLPKLLRVGVTAVLVAIFQCSLMVWLGYVVGQAFGWSQLASFYAGAAIAISSTTIIIKAFEEQKIKEDFTHVVFGILIV